MGSCAFANLEVSVASLESATNKTLVELDTKNTFDQGIKDARAWVFLMDAEGKVVGNQLSPRPTQSHARHADATGTPSWTASPRPLCTASLAAELLRETALSFTKPH